MTTCPECGGTGFVTIVDRVPDYTDPQRGIGYFPVPCSQCNPTKPALGWLPVIVLIITGMLIVLAVILIAATVP